MNPSANLIEELVPARAREWNGRRHCIGNVDDLGISECDIQHHVHGRRSRAHAFRAAIGDADLPRVQAEIEWQR